MAMVVKKIGSFTSFGEVTTRIHYDKFYAET